MKVNFIIAGFQKCGTTALHTFLSSHPKVIGSKPKETDFFNYDFQKGTTFYHKKYFKKAPFSGLKGIKYLEASPSYLNDKNATQTAKNIYAYNKNVKIIGLVRDPIDRAFSAWNMYRQRFFSGDTEWWVKWVENRTGEYPNVIRREEEEYHSFYRFVKNEIESIENSKKIECPILNLGLYADGIEAYKSQFGKNFKIVKNENLKENTVKELQDIADFLRLKPFNWQVFDKQKVFEGTYKQPLSKEAETLLKQFYNIANQDLKKLTGIQY